MVQFSFIRDLARKQLTEYMDQCSGTKAIVWDEALTGPVDLVANSPARAMATKEFEHRPVGYAPRNWWVVHPWVGWLVSMGLVGHDSEESLLLLGGGDTRV